MTWKCIGLLCLEAANLEPLCQHPNRQLGVQLGIQPDPVVKSGPVCCVSGCDTGQTDQPLWVCVLPGEVGWLS